MEQNMTGAVSAPIPHADRAIVRFKDACTEAGVSVATMRRYLKAGHGPRLVRLSERVHGFRRGDLNAWVESRAAAK